MNPSALSKMPYYILTAAAALKSRKKIGRMPVFQDRFLQRFIGDELHVCFGCSPTNPKGMKLEFHKTDIGGLATKWTPQYDMVSFPNIVHGGLSATLLDELGGVLIQSDLNAFALTVSTRINYHSPVYADRPLLAHAKILGKFRRYVLVEGVIFSDKGKILSTMTTLYFIPSTSMFKHITKLTAVSESIASYLVD